MHRSAFLSIFMAFAGAASAHDLDDAVLRGSGFEPTLTAAPVYPADGPSYPIDADTPFAPPAAVPGLPALREFHIELGGRYWYSNGSFAKDLYDDPRFSNHLNSRLTYSGLTGQSFEVFGRVDHASGFFLKGFVGLGRIDGGALADEDFIVPYSSTTSPQRDGRLAYFTADFGYSFLQGPGYRVGAFAGYNYMGERANAYGCAQTATNLDICVPAIPSSVLAITEDAGWNSIRLGIAADVLLFNRLRLSADAAWVPFTRLVSNDSHWLREDIFGAIAEKGSGDGVQLEAFAAYQLTECWSFGVGARYWRMRASGNIFLEDAEEFYLAVPQPGAFTTDRFGVFAQGSYKFGVD
jgi:hypothetical protein